MDACSGACSRRTYRSGEGSAHPGWEQAALPESTRDTTPSSDADSASMRPLDRLERLRRRAERSIGSLERLRRRARLSIARFKSFARWREGLIRPIEPFTRRRRRSTRRIKAFTRRCRRLIARIESFTRRREGFTRPIVFLHRWIERLTRRFRRFTLSIEPATRGRARPAPTCSWSAPPSWSCPCTACSSGRRTLGARSGRT